MSGEVGRSSLFRSGAVNVPTARRWVWLALIALWALVGWTPPVARADETPLDPVVLQLKWRHQFQFAGYYQAIKQGYYRQAGLAVTLKEAQPGIDPTEDVVSGKADFGVGTSELVLSRSKGEPVVVLATIYQHSPLVLIAKRQADLEDLQALKNRPVMIEPLSAELFAYFRNEGINPAKLKLVPHTFDVADLIHDRVAAMSGYSTDEPFFLKQAKLDYLVFTPRSGGIDFYGDSLFTTEGEIKAHPARVEAFRRASLKGWDYALAHPEETADLILDSYSTRKTRDHLLFEARQSIRLIHPELIEIGHMNPGRWQHIADTYGEFGMVPAGFSLKGFLYDPDPAANYTRLYWLLAILGAVTVACLGWILPLIQLNRRLRQEVASRRQAQEELRLAKEAAEDANRAKSQFLASMSHEIRTPMNAVIGLASLLLEGTLTEQQRDYIETIHSSGDALLAIISDILDVSKIESGKLEILNEVFSPAECVAGVFGLLAPRAGEKRLGLTHEFSAGVPRQVLGDCNRVRQVLVNVIGNAIKFTSTGQISLSVASRPVGADFNELLFTVVDTGIGVAPDVRGKLFQSFSQGDASISRRYGGTGLGLAISKRLCELMDGRIEMESELGKGTTVRFSVRVGVAAAPAFVAPVPAAPVATKGAVREERILLAEDNLVNQKVALNMLRHLGYAADVAFNGQEVLAAVERERYDIILMDVQMPEMDGLEAARRLKQSSSGKFPRPWIIAVTANTMPGDREACLAAGMDDYIGKPVKTKELEQALTRARARESSP